MGWYWLLNSSLYKILIYHTWISVYYILKFYLVAIGDPKKNQIPYET